MTEAEFWTIVAASRPSSAGGQEEQSQLLLQRLIQLSPEEVVSFKQRLDEQLDAAYRWDLWGAAYLLLGGCGDDSFEYFRLWLIAQGQETFARVLAEPDALALVAPPEPEEQCEFELFAYVAFDAYEQLTDGEFPATSREAPTSPTGHEWDFENDDEMKTRYPRLWTRVERA